MEAKRAEGERGGVGDAPARHVINYVGKRYEMDYVFEAEVAALHHPGRAGRFQEIVVLEWIAGHRLKGTYIDVGAHIGNHTLFFLNHCPSTFVVSIEAHPKIGALLEGNIKRNSKREMINWSVYHAAAWSASNEKVKLAPIPRNNAGHTHVAGPKDPIDVEVNTLRLDDIPIFAPVRVLKIDVEDTEMQVIAGAQRLLAEHHPILIAERHTAEQRLEFDAEVKTFGYRRTAEWPGIHTYAWQVS
jgi:FkbM family methyltransferase